MSTYDLKKYVHIRYFPYTLQIEPISHLCHSFHPFFICQQLYHLPCMLQFSIKVANYDFVKTIFSFFTNFFEAFIKGFSEWLEVGASAQTIWILYFSDVFKTKHAILLEGLSIIVILFTLSFWPFGSP